MRPRQEDSAATRGDVPRRQAVAHSARCRTAGNAVASKRRCKSPASSELTGNTTTAAGRQPTGGDVAGASVFRGRFDRALRSPWSLRRARDVGRRVGSTPQQRAAKYRALHASRAVVEDAAQRARPRYNAVRAAAQRWDGAAEGQLVAGNDGGSLPPKRQERGCRRRRGLRGGLLWAKLRVPLFFGLLEGSSNLV